MGLGVALLQGFGTYSFQVKDPQQFVTQIVGAQGAYKTTDIEERLRTMLLSKLQDVLGETGAKNSVPEMIGLTEEIGAAVRVKSKDDFEAIGLTLKTFYVGNLKPLINPLRNCAIWACSIWLPILNSRPRMQCVTRPVIPVAAQASQPALALGWALVT
jgi:hypothetical protein